MGIVPASRYASRSGSTSASQARIASLLSRRRPSNVIVTSSGVEGPAVRRRATNSSPDISGTRRAIRERYRTGLASRAPAAASAGTVLSGISIARPGRIGVWQRDHRRTCVDRRGPSIVPCNSSRPRPTLCVRSFSHANSLAPHRRVIGLLRTKMRKASPQTTFGDTRTRFVARTPSELSARRRRVAVQVVRRRAKP